MSSREKVSPATLRERKRRGEKFPVLTCYDYATARAMEEAGLDVLLVGDSAAEVVLGHSDTRAIGLDFLLELTAGVRRGAPRALLIGDMPFAAGYHASVEAGMEAAKRFRDEAGCDVVKIELTTEQTPVLEAVAAAGIDVMAHIGLRPQWIAEHGGYKAQGKDAASALELIETARRMEESGATMLLLEAVASEVSEIICSRTKLPVVGCVAGPACDGTVVVLHDMVGWGGGHPPRKVKRYGDVREVLLNAFRGYAEDVRGGRFPAAEHSIRMPASEWESLRNRLGDS
jgi:3-methyl-2-oxobutanoate hydroxymethyltransferase